ncbi:primary-amine oxidase [Actinomadura coerulea]|uniref:primary-amine oxidase n=1 Tax=Actinomadura coerulea TaxID=46159 RepID=UPI003429E44C
MIAHNAAQPHPLDPLTGDELREVTRTLIETGLLTASGRVAYAGLDEPTRSELEAEIRPERRARVVLHETTRVEDRDVLVSVTGAKVLSERILDAATEGQSPVLDEEYELAERVLAEDHRWVTALARRGLRPDQVRAAALSAGVFEDPAEEGRRILRALAFQQRHPDDHAWAHPVDGLVAFVDIVARQVTEVLDEGAVDVPGGDDGNYHLREEPPRGSQRPLLITQPEGPSFTLAGRRLQWENWDLRLGFDAREGLILHQVGFHDEGRLRPVLHRASISEMVVPYGDPSPVRSWQNYFDTGEYLVGRYANSLELGCDCLGEITYLDAVVADAQGEPKVIKNAICLHEEDHGVLWKHSDPWALSSETRRNRRMVVSFFTTVGNYDYGFYFYLYLDGTFAFEAKATGIVFTSAVRDPDCRHTAQIAPGLGAPFHQHLFCARLHMAVDGPTNRVEEVEAVRMPVGPDNPRGNAFTRSRTPLTRESEAQRFADTSTGRTWHVVNPNSLNRVGEPVAYALHPEGQPTLLADPSSSIARRAAFATRHLWVTRAAPGEKYAAGDFVNRHPGGAGLPAYVAADRDIDGQDIVVWHTFGLTHFPRTEDWPVMPVDHTGFTLRPAGFFDSNPTLDVPPGRGRHAAEDQSSEENSCGCPVAER